MLIVFNLPRDDMKMKIPNGYFPSESTEYVISQLGFKYLSENKNSKIKERLVNLPGRDIS